MKYLSIVLLLLNFSVKAQDTISKTSIEQASILLDVKYTDKEIDMMLPDLKDNLVDYKKMHLLPLNNSVAMSMSQRLQPEIGRAHV